MTECLQSRTPLRRFLVRAVRGRRPPGWLTARRAWQLYGFLEWLAFRVQDLALQLEDRESAV